MTMVARWREMPEVSAQTRAGAPNVEDEQEMTMENVARYPHCDVKVLHAPGKCDFCDMYPEMQQWRIDSNTQFTGEDYSEDQIWDPAQIIRPLEIIERWYGNVPKHG